MSAVSPAAPLRLTTRARLTAADVMTSPVITVRPDATVKEIASLMLAHHISGLPVVSAGNEVIGIVTETDLLHKERGPLVPDGRLRHAFRSLHRGRDLRKKAGGLTASDLMSAPPITVDEAAPLHEIAALMVRRAINRVPVMRDGRLVGIVSRADIVQALTRADAEVADAVRGTLLHDLWLDISQLSVEVRDGVVALGGQVERWSERELAARWAAAVDGVVAVDNHLEFEYDDREVHLGDRWPAPRV
jgi:CBS domain-containing protein